MGNVRNEYKIVVEERGGNRPLGTPSGRLLDIIKMDLKLDSKV
jgi:hypothetical protein